MGGASDKDNDGNGRSVKQKEVLSVQHAELSAGGSGVTGVQLPNMTLEAGDEVKGGALPLTSDITQLQ